MRALAIAAVALALAGCDDGNAVREGTSNPAFNVKRLFTHDGCAVYRFEDFRPVYYVVCEEHRVAQTSWMHSYRTGKVHHQQVMNVIATKRAR